MSRSQPFLRLSPEESLANQSKETVISACVLYENKTVMKTARDQKIAMMRMRMMRRAQGPAQRPTSTTPPKNMTMTTLYIAKTSAVRTITKPVLTCGMLLSVHLKLHVGILSACPARTVEQHGPPDFFILRGVSAFVTYFVIPIPSHVLVAIRQIFPCTVMPGGDYEYITALFRIILIAVSWFCKYSRVGLQACS